jgi:pimeloyl-ACP methyl ester carboxylesterase
MNLVTQGLMTQYFDDGANTKPVVLMLHGWGAESHSFDALAASLSPDFRILRLDLPGFGGTQAPAVPWYVRDYAQFVANFLRKLEVRQVEAVLGHSFGGRIVLKGLGEGIFTAQQAILLDSAGITHPPTWHLRAFGLVAHAGKRLLSLPGINRFAPSLRRRLYHAAGNSDYLESGPLRETFLNLINEDLSGAAARLTVPALLIWGADDVDTPPTDGQILANLIPISTFSLIAGAGHFVHTDAPDRVARLISDFLA